MKIAYVINSVEGGGAASPVPALARVLTAHGAEVRVLALTRRDGRGLAPMEAAGLRVSVRPGGDRDHAAALAWLDRQIGDEAPDLIWTSLTRATLLGQMVGARRGRPVVSWQHAAYLKPANRILLRATQRLSALWVGDSESVTALTAQRLGVGWDRLATWPLFSADSTAPRARPWRPGGKLSLGSLGRLHPVKGYDILIAALTHLHAQGFRPPTPFEVAIAGEGAEREALQSAAAAAGLDNLRLAGFVDNPRRWLSGLHAYLQPSRSEGLCIAAHEAMQAGLPTIVSAVGELPYSVVPGQTGWVVPPADPRALAAALRELLSNPDRLAAMGAASRERLFTRFGAEAFEAAGAAVLARLSLSAAGRSTSVPA
ncbi:MAG: glycosyltransferase family 4 protein, partial [Phenylobacterium sp.]